MTRNIILDKIFIAKCEICGIPANFRGLSGGEIFLLCEKHSQGFDKSKIKSLAIPVRNQGLFKTKSVAEVGGQFSSEHWKDFGLNRKRYYLAEDEKRRDKIAGDYLFQVVFLTLGKNIGKITSQKKTYDLWVCEDIYPGMRIPTFPETKIPVGILLDSNNKKIRFMEVHPGTDYNF